MSFDWRDMFAIACAAWSCVAGKTVPGAAGPSGGPAPSASPSANALPPVTGAFAYATFGYDGMGGIAGVPA